MMILMYFGSALALKGVGNMGQEKLIAFLVVFSQIIQPAKNITTAWFSIQKGMASIDRIDQILEAEEKISEKENALPVTDSGIRLNLRMSGMGIIMTLYLKI